MVTRFDQGVFVLVLLLAAAVRLLHLQGPLDEPSWRQADTAYMALRMLYESPPDVLNPKAPYRGTNDVKAAEFPIYPFAVSLAYKIQGEENLVLARLVSLLFFAGATWYFLLSARVLLGSRAALYATLAYLLLPVGIFYSRAVHPDFSIVFFSHAFFYHLLRHFDSRSLGHYVLSILAATAAFLMKAPYCFYFGLPVAAWVLSRREGWTIRNFAALGAVLVVPLVAAVWFNHYRLAMESGFVESLLYPMKWTAESTTGRFFGSLAQRLDGQVWIDLARRVVILVSTPPGLLLAAAGCVWPARRGEGRGWLAVIALCLGAGLYLLVVFPMVTSPHEYYSIPFMAPLALLIGRCIDLVLPTASRSGLDRLRAFAGPVLALALVAGSAYGMNRGAFLYGEPYFSRDWQRIRAGEAIAAHTEPDDLVVSMTLGRSTGWSDPRILYFANRRGWSIDLEYRTAEQIEAYRDAGAACVALLVTPAYPLSDDQVPLLARFPREVYPLTGPGGEAIGWVVLFDVRK